MARRETQTKAKAFAYLMDQLAWIGDDLLVDASGGRIPGGFRPAKMAYWTWVFPEIGTDSAKRSRFQANKRPEELIRLVARPQGGFLAESSRSNLRPDVLASFELASVLGWLMRSEDGPFSELFSSDRHFAERINRQTIATYLGLLSEDFAGRQPFLFDGLQDAVSEIMLGISKSAAGRVCPWDFDFDHYGSYLVRKHRAGGNKEDWRADLVTLLAMSSLLGPKDYRADLLIDEPEKFETTLGSEREALPSSQRQMVRTYDLEYRTFLTRITFDRPCPDELDWIMCEEDLEAPNTGAERLLSVPLEGRQKVVMARALPRFSDSGGVVEIPLNCREASSKAHLVLERADDGWTCRDLGSSNGTLVVSRDGKREMLYRKLGSANKPVRLRNGDVICIAPDHATGHAVATNPAFLFHVVTISWH